METFVKTIFIVLLGYYSLKFLFKLAMPYLMRYITKKASQKFGDAFGQQPQKNSKTEEGDVSIDIFLGLIRTITQYNPKVLLLNI